MEDGHSAIGAGTVPLARIRLANRPAELRRLTAWLGLLAPDLPVPEEARARLDLVLTEAATNVIAYAWDDAAAHHFTVEIACSRDRVAAVLEDDGRPFDPLDHPPPPLPQRLEDAAEGGRGIHLMRSQSDHMGYHRAGVTNRLTLVVQDRGRDAARRPAGLVPRGPERRASPQAPAFPLRLDNGGVVAVERRQRADRRTHAWISGQQLCAGIPYGLVEPILSRCPQRSLEPGEVLLTPGEHNEHLFLVLEGRLQVHLDAADSRLGFPIEAGECAGEMSIIDGKPVSAYVVAETPCTVLPVHRDLFWERLARSPGMSRNLMELLAERMRRRNDVILGALEHRLRLHHLERELATARRIQASMLPARSPLFPAHPQLDVDALMEPAREVGGDFFDAFPIDDRRICVAVGDVADKGIAAALFMVRTMTLLRTEVLAQGTVDRLLETVNRQLADANASFMFATVFVAVVDATSGRMRYVSGGHPAPLLQRANGPPAPLPAPPGILVGIAPDARYGTAEVTLAPGDVLTLYTDGVTEAEDPGLAQFGAARLAATLARLGGVDAAGRVAEVREAVRGFAAGATPSDDITLLVLRYRGDP